MMRKESYVICFILTAGLLVIIDDGTVAGCPRCSLVEESIEALYSAKPLRKYIVEENGSLLVNGNEKVFPKEINEDGFREWAMIDYKWLIDL